MENLIVNFKKLFTFFVLFVNLLFISYSTYYADIQIDLDSQGLIDIYGKSDLEELINIENSPNYTSKSGSVWFFNLTTSQVMDSFLFELILPPGASINYIKTTPNFRIDEREGRIVIIGVGENKPLTILVQYEIKSKFEEKVSLFGDLIQNYIFILVGFFGIFFGFLISKLFHKFDENKKIKAEISKLGINTKTELVKGDLEVKNGSALKFDTSILPQRQRDILDILKDREKITQKELESLMEIPKSSVSRNVKTLEVKGLIEKVQVGQTNYLSLK